MCCLVRVRVCASARGSQRPAREPDALCGQRLGNWLFVVRRRRSFCLLRTRRVICVSVQLETLVVIIMNLQATSAVLCKAANLAAGYQSHVQSLGSLGKCCNPSPPPITTPTSYLIQKQKQISQTNVQGSGSRSVWGGCAEVCSVETSNLVTRSDECKKKKKQPSERGRVKS
ncbi:hypothetical protein BBK36DRAFT_1130496 [Trichoderma citrinoviride]|uniref:Uncharacterized protein n=1 Tax=Trichoderma citrinoviride TaxID=58853 RepID=A0A2T4AXU8_9HYPO|nr:hypothetical protein BBK36DRAFT_1130496 [Trichoderma citrinoviride]PTB61910.1 hypothetical protein BBK36DRAFT_1130496 [Trichoderma citrinoviride]